MLFYFCCVIIINNNSLHLYSAFLGTQSALHGRGEFPQPPPVCSIHLDDARQPSLCCELMFVFLFLLCCELMFVFLISLCCELKFAFLISL